MNPTSSASYLPRTAVDRALSEHLQRGTGVIGLEGPPGAGKSAALLHALWTERERRGKAGRGYVRLLQLWGDEPPSLFARRMVREVGFLHLVAYPQPERLGKLVADMAQAIPGLASAGKLLAALVPDDMRPLPVVAAQALAEAGGRAVDYGGEQGGPLVLGVDLLGGEVSAPVREFFTRLCEQLPPTVVMVLAQPGGQQCLAPVAPAQRVAIGAFSIEEARAYLEPALGTLDAESLAVLTSGRLSLLPGDLAQVVNLYHYLGAARLRGESGLRAVSAYLERDQAARYQLMLENALGQPGAVDVRALELCAWVAVTARSQQPLSLERFLARVGMPPVRPSEAALLRQAPLVRALCATAATVSAGTPGRQADTPSPAGAANANASTNTNTNTGPGTANRPSAPELLAVPVAVDSGWPLLPSSAAAREGVLSALLRNGLLDVYQRRFLDELLATLRGPLGRDGLTAGVQALSLLVERAARDKAALGQAVVLLGEMETPLWRAGWHRAFAELYDALLPHLWRAGVAPRDVAPQLWFRRARTRIQGADWAAQGGPVVAGSPLSQVLREDLPLALEELTELLELDEAKVVQARARLQLGVDGREVASWCQHLPFKARQARGYARVLRLLHTIVPAAGGSSLTLTGSPLSEGREGALRQAALDDILLALGHFAAAAGGASGRRSGQLENLAQTLAILGDFYSAREGGESDRLALQHYDQALTVATEAGEAGTPGEQPTSAASFCLGMIHRARGNHHRRRDRPADAAAAYAEARRSLLRSPDARMGTLLAGLLAPL